MNDGAAGFFAALVFACVALLAGCNFGQFSIKEDAVKNGVAEYYLDENHEKQFRWRGEK